MTPKIMFRIIPILVILFFASVSPAAVLHWSAVESTEECTISGYKVYYGTSSSQLNQAVDAGNVTAYDLELLSLEPGMTYYFAVSAYSTTNLEGPMSSPPLSYTTPGIIQPQIVEYPVISHSADTIDVTFSKNDMTGADIKTNYDFSPTLIFNSTAIQRTDQTYRLFFNYIPEYIIITMTVSGIIDNEGNQLVSNTITLNDDDTDLMADDWEAHFGVGAPLSDADNDGLDNREEYALGTSPIDDDSDNDGMDDRWEVDNGLNPVLDDADGDIDNDGVSNLDEYLEGTGVSNSGPEKPVLQLPLDTSPNIAVTPLLSTNAYTDPENDAHAKTQWQISTEPTFEIEQEIALKLESYDFLTSLTIPGFILEPGRTYYWRVRFFDAPGGRSLWSDSFSFTTVTVNPDDEDGNGVPDIQQVTDGTIDLDNDGYFDVASSTYKMVSGNDISLGLQASGNVAEVEFLKHVDPDDISDTNGKPAALDFGLIEFKIRVDNIGDTATVKVYFSEEVGDTWYKYDLINGWTTYSSDYPNNVTFSSDRKSVLLRLVDGGAGDSDGIANGVIVDPSGPGAVVSESSVSSSAASTAGGGGGGGGCFIATAAFGSYVEKHVKILRDFRDFFLLKTRWGTAFVKAYYRYSPPIADIIAKHDTLKAVVRAGLMPLIGFGYVAVYMPPLQQWFMLFAAAGILLLILKFRSLRKKSAEKRKFAGRLRLLKKICA